MIGGVKDRKLQNTRKEKDKTKKKKTALNFRKVMQRNGSQEELTNCPQHKKQLEK